MKKKKKPFFKRVWVWILIVIILAIGIPALTMPFSYGVQKAIIRVVCTPFAVSKPDNYDEIVSSTDIIEDISYNSVYENGYLDIISPKDNTEILPLLVYIHGGYYVGGDKKGLEPYCMVVANEGFIVANINYVLAPDEIYPAQAIQANEAIKFLAQNADTYNIDINNIFIGGDSAGSHLSAQMGAFYTNPDLQDAMGMTPAIEASQLKGVVLLCGFYNMFTVRETRFPLVNDAMWMLTGEKKFEEYSQVNELNIIENVTEDYPNTYLLCGDKDPFYEQNKEMKAKLEEKGINLVAYLPLSTNKNLMHEFQNKFHLEEAAIAMDMLIEFLEENSD